VYTALRKTLTEKLVLIQVREDLEIISFDKLCWRIHWMIVPHLRHQKRTMVLGPISNKDPDAVKSNLEALSLQAKRLSDAGWVVVDIASCYDITERLLRMHHTGPGYPFILLEEFTLPLIRSRLFNNQHLRSPFVHNVGKKLE